SSLGQHETSCSRADCERWLDPRLPEDAAPAHAAQMGISWRQDRRRRTTARRHAPGTGRRTGDRGGGWRRGRPHVHEYPGGGSVELRFFEVRDYQGEIENRIFREIRWVTRKELL